MGTFSIFFGVTFCFGGGLQKIAGKGMSLTLMWSGCGSEHRGTRANRVSHTDGGCGDGLNQVKNAAPWGCRCLKTKLGDSREEDVNRE
jgi:hypothetical protein